MIDAMIDTCNSFDEDRRLKVLAEYSLLDTPCEEEFDRIVALTARIFRTPVATMTLVDAERQFFKAAVGVTNRETSREVAFCAHALECDQLLIVPDATRDYRFKANPLVTGEPGIRFYAGAPLASHTGDILGTLCIIDFEPRPTLSEEV
jgi:GAF domain-containing protein